MPDIKGMMDLLKEANWQQCIKFVDISFDVIGVIGTSSVRKPDGYDIVDGRIVKIGESNKEAKGFTLFVFPAGF